MGLEGVFERTVRRFGELLLYQFRSEVSSIRAPDIHFPYTQGYRAGLNFSAQIRMFCL